MDAAQLRLCERILEGVETKDAEKFTIGTVVKNTKHEELSPSKELLQLVDKLGGTKFLPRAPAKRMTFELHNTTTELANAMRRTYCGEMEIFALTCDEESIDTDDVFIIPHEICNRINLVPIRQIAGLEMELDVRNDTPHDIIIYTDALREVGGYAKEKAADLFSHTIPLMYLKPSCYIKITKIRSTLSIGRENACHTLPGRMGYKCIELDHADSRIARGEKLQIKSSLNVHPTMYQLTVPWQRWIEPRRVVQMITESLTAKLTKIKTSIAEASQVPYYSGVVDIYIEHGAHIFKLHNETQTVGSLMSRYAYELDPSVKNVSCSREHESHEYVIVRVKHGGALELMLRAVDVALAEVKAIDDAFR